MQPIILRIEQAGEVVAELAVGQGPVSVQLVDGETGAGLGTMAFSWPEPVVVAEPDEPAVEEALEVESDEPAVEEALEIEPDEPAVEEALEIELDEPAVEEALEIELDEPAVEEALEIEPDEPGDDDHATVALPSEEDAEPLPPELDRSITRASPVSPGVERTLSMETLPDGADELSLDLDYLDEPSRNGAAIQEAQQEDRRTDLDPMSDFSDEVVTVVARRPDELSGPQASWERGLPVSAGADEGREAEGKDILIGPEDDFTLPLPEDTEATGDDLELLTSELEPTGYEDPFSAEREGNPQVMVPRTGEVTAGLDPDGSTERLEGAEVWFRKEDEWTPRGALATGQHVQAYGGLVRCDEHGGLVILAGPRLQGSATLPTGEVRQVASGSRLVRLPPGSSVILWMGDQGIYVRSNAPADTSGNILDDPVEYHKAPKTHRWAPPPPDMEDDG